MKVRIVTGYVPLPNRDHRNYNEYGAKLLALPAPNALYKRPLEKTWLWQWLFREGILETVTHSVSDNPDKNTLFYHCVQHQKSEWLVKAAMEDTESDVFAWIDYGIFHVPGVTKDVVLGALERARDDSIVAPGCWEHGYYLDDGYPCWRFCGGFLTVPRSLVFGFDQLVKREAKRHIRETNNVSWEVNTWARSECLGSFVPTWYKADHNDSMFTNYGV